MSRIDYEEQYNNSARVPEFPEIAARWQAESEAYRRDAPATLDVSYGPEARQRFDLYGTHSGPLAVYLHGGYWQEGDRTLYGFVARALVQQGLRVAIPSYRLAPVAGILDIVDDIRRFLVALWQRTGARTVLVGHSAGGHLTAAMLATDWGAWPGAPERLAEAGLSISGVFELEPLIGTSINQRLGLDRASARAASPRLWPAPRAGRLVAAVGGQEGEEFHRQSRELTAAWGGAGVQAEYLSVAGANHFTVLDSLTTPGGELQRRLLALAPPGGS